jgi:hypothetical protein
MRPKRRALSSLLSVTLVAACMPEGTTPEAVVVGNPSVAAAPIIAPVAEPVAELSAVRGAGGVRTEDLAEGTYIRAGARLQAGQRLVVPPGTLAELRLNDGTLLRLNEDTRVTVPGLEDRTLELVSGELVAIVTAEQGPLRVRAGTDTLELRSGEGRVWSRGDRRSYDLVYGTARLDSEGGGQGLGPGTHIETPLAPDRREATLERSLRPLEQTAWSRAFEVAAASIDAVPAGIGSLTARRAGSSTTLHRLSVTEQKVQVAISGRIARTEIEQTFYNETADVLEGTYRFPLPGDASISGLSLLVGDKWMDAEMLEKSRARAVFRKIVDATIPRDPALLEWEQGNIFKMRIFPIPGRGARKIRLAYTQVLPAVGETLRYRYPLAGTSSGAAGEQIGDFEFTVTVDRRGLPKDAEPVTPMAQLERRVLADRIELSTRAQQYRPVHDLGVDLPLAADRQRLHAETHLDRDGQAYFMLALRPDLKLAAGDRPTHYAFVLDRSHSMTPELWTVARGLVQALAGTLGKDDRMTVLACDAACDLAPGGLAPAAEALPVADAFLDLQTLAGASDLGGMMRSAARALDGADMAGADIAGPGALAEPGAVDRVIVYLGDGNVSAGELAPDELLRHLQRPLAGTRVQAVALGARSDVLVLDALTRRTGGDLLRADVRDDLRGLVRELRLRAELPVARQIELSLPANMVHVHPQKLASLRPGETVLLVGKLAGPVHGALTLQATGPTGHVSTDSFQIDLEAAPDRAPHLPRTWARLEIDDLTATRGHAARAEIIDLSQQYTVLSRYTALIALENDAMYREFNVTRQASQTTGWNGNIGGVAPARGDDTDATEDADKSGDKGAEAPKKPQTESPLDVLDVLDGPESDDEGGLGLSGSGRGGGGTGEGTIGIGDSGLIGKGGGVGSGYGRGAGAGYGGRSRSVFVWDLGAMGAPDATSLARLEPLRQAVLRDPTSRAAHRKLVVQAIRIGAPDALPYATAWSQADPDHAPALLAVADLLAAHSDAIAMRAYGSAVEVDPFNIKVQIRLAEAHAFKGDLARSCAHRRAVVSIEPGRPEHHMQLVRCLGEFGDGVLAHDAAEDGLGRARGKTSELQAALAGVIPPERSRAVTGDLSATLTWTGAGDLDLAFIDPRGRRLSALRREGLRVEEHSNQEIAAVTLAGSAPQNYAIEVTRFAGQGQISGELKLRADGQARSYPFTIDQGSLRLASASYVEKWSTTGANVRAGKATVQGKLDKDIIRRIVRAHFNEVKYCYRQGLLRRPNLAGRVAIQFVISSEGKVVSAVPSSSTLQDPGVATCITQAARRWSFPRPEEGVVLVTYPFIFENR